MGIVDNIKKLFGRDNYDLDTLDGINSIPVKLFEYKPKKGERYAYNSIEYVLQRKATEHKRNGRLDLAIACLRKSNEIMPLSDTLYTADNYLRLAKYLRLDKQFEEAHRVEEEYLGEKSKVTHKAIHEQMVEHQIESAEQFGTDLMEVTCTSYHCAECSAYGNRVYSMSGEDERFPKMPEYINNHSEHCGMLLYPYFHGLNTLYNPYTDEHLLGDDVIAYSNRPFADNRPLNWVNGYERWCEIRHIKDVDNANSKQAQIEYEQIQTKLPEQAPKSQGGYLRMKKSDSDNFKKIKALAIENGIEIKPIIEY